MQKKLKIKKLFYLVRVLVAAAVQDISATTINASTKKYRT